MNYKKQQRFGKNLAEGLSPLGWKAKEKYDDNKYEKKKTVIKLFGKWLAFRIWLVTLSLQEYDQILGVSMVAINLAEKNSKGEIIFK